MLVNERKKIALFGGSFDPVTDAHADIVKELSQRFSEVVLMPAAVSPFKAGEKAPLDGNARVAMLKLAVRGMKNVTVSRYELKRAGISYTADTLRYLHKEYSDCDIYTVIGSEELPRLNKWKDKETLKKSTVFYVVERNGFPAAKQAEKAEKCGWKVRIAPFTAGSASSSAVKLACSFGAEVLPTPSAVAKYIKKNALYEDYRYITDRYEEFGLKKERIEHIRGVAETAIVLAKRYGVSVNKAVVAALLHDIGKETGAEWFSARGIKLPVGVSSLPVAVRHAEYGAVIARECFGLEDLEILDAIRLHTTGDTGMSALSEVVFLADYTEDGRNTDVAEKTRLAARKSLKKGMETALFYTIEHLKEVGGEICPRTECAYNYYVGKAPHIAAPISAPNISKTEADDSQTSTIAEDPEFEPSWIAESEASARRAAAPERYRLSQSEAKDLAEEIGEYLCEKKGFDVIVIDVSKRTVVTDYFVVASASSTTQVRALVDYVDEKLSKGKGLEPLHRDCNSSQWYAVDYGSVILHVFLKSTREIYSLERLWGDGTNIEQIV